MYTYGNRTCGKGGEREIACSPVETIPAEWEVSVKSHVVPRKLYLWKRRDDKTACISAEREMQIRNDVNKIRKWYVVKKSLRISKYIMYFLGED